MSEPITNGPTSPEPPGSISDVWQWTAPKLSATMWCEMYQDADGDWSTGATQAWQEGMEWDEEITVDHGPPCKPYRCRVKHGRGQIFVGSIANPKNA